jgi:hypothetical protein
MSEQASFKMVPVRMRSIARYFIGVVIRKA